MDWGLAQSIGVRFAPKGPQVDPELARDMVAQLRVLASQSVAPVAELTGLVLPEDSPSAVVVDRGEWIRSNVEGFRVAMRPITVPAAERSSLVPAVGARLTAAQLGGALAWLSGKVLGQYEAFTDDPAGGRLLLVAPNIMAVERELGLVPADFRLWVCLHEQTHRFQFGAVPWMREHFLAEVQQFVAASETSIAEFASRLGAIAQAVVAAARRQGTASVVEAVQTPAQRVVFDRLTGLMSLLEGHADYVMDEVGPQYVPSVATIRQRFNDRRARAGTVDSFARRVLGLETKMRQYTEGADFVRAVIGRAGRSGFDQVWANPQNLPGAAEITNPDAWVSRVLG